MLTAEQIRRANLAALVAAEALPNEKRKMPGIARFAAKIGKSEHQLYQWLVEPESAHHRNISGDMARSIERACRKEEGWMDHIHSSKKQSAPSKGTMILAVKAVRMSVDVYLRPKTINDLSDEDLGAYLFSAYNFISNGPRGGGPGQPITPEASVFDFGKLQAKIMQGKKGLRIVKNDQ